MGVDKGLGRRHILSHFVIRWITARHCGLGKWVIHGDAADHGGRVGTRFKRGLNERGSEGHHMGADKGV